MSNSSKNRNGHLIGTIESPCVKTCKLDIKGTYCIGCLRTRSEIAVWSSSDDETKREILKRVEQRIHSVLPDQG
ncbi:DUF1289 domain-containing protein [Kordiimonas pumila]